MQVVVPVFLDSTLVFVALGADSISARAEAERVQQTLERLQEHPDMLSRLQLRERNGNGFLLADTAAVVVIHPGNRADTTLSPLANALFLREYLLERQPVPAARWSEEELLLRLLLGVLYPFLLLVILRLTRTGVRRWERRWRGRVGHWLDEMAAHRGLSPQDIQSRKVVRLLVAVERLCLYGGTVIVVSFGWFALFPQTRPLAVTLLAKVIAPLVDLIGLTARSALLLGYTALLALTAYKITAHLAQRRLHGTLSPLLTDPVVYLPLRAGIWIAAVFLILFPYPGAPRLFAVGLVLLVLLTALIALRPVIEEIAAGIYLETTYALKKGDRLTLDGAPCIVVDQGLAHLRIARQGEMCWIPYTKILKAELNISSEPSAHL
ncbi:MAG: hypothetical protein HYW07_03615 [Candidatus Latescibacteria bacterium]|nr:hypothetical protein [Candidatus Latescibacterota bacterium]